MADLTLVTRILLVVFAAAWLLQLFYYLRFYLPAAWQRQKEPSTASPPVSVVICARNEARNLQQFLPAVLEQEYHDYEVIVVNDSSEDSSGEVLWDLGQKYPHLRSTHLQKDPRHAPGKKMALLVGIKSARHEIVLLTDADCRPVSPQWISEMMQAYGPGTQMVLGYGGYKRTGSLTNNLQRYDTATIALQYGGFALAGIPYMGVGRNLSYRRSLFLESKGMARHMHLFSGDDDLFVNREAPAKRTRIQFSAPAHTRSVPAENPGEWLRQKKRHITTFALYKPLHKLLLLLEPAARMLYYGSLAYLLTRQNLLYYTLVAAGLRLLVQLLTYYKGYRKLEEKGLLLSSLIWDILYPFIGIGLSISNMGKPNPKNWK